MQPMPGHFPKAWAGVSGVCSKFTFGSDSQDRYRTGELADAAICRAMTRFRHGLPLLILLLPLFSAFAQKASFTFLGFEAHDYPRLRARFFLTDSAGGVIRDLFPADFHIRDNGVDYSPLVLSCPSPAPPARLSSVLAVDISGSMFNRGNIEIARAAADAWIEAIPLGYSECALTSFDDQGYVNSDFSISRQALHAKVALLNPNNGGTDYNAGLLADPVGAIRLAAAGAHKRVVVFLTDGEGGGNENAMVRAALDSGVTVYAVVLRMRAPQLLKNVAERTGGLWFDGVESREQAVEIYRTILRIAGGEEPCELTWEVDPDCIPHHDLEIDLPLYQANWKGRYVLPDSVFPALGFSPFGVAFGVVPAGSANDSVLTITARNRPVTLQSIASDNPSFSIVSGADDLPALLQPGESRTVTVRFAPADSAFHYGKILLQTDACSVNAVGCTGGLPGLPTPETPLRLIAPNGGEIFNVGESVLIEWEGILPEDTVALEYSVDGGVAWKPITDSATGLRYLWTAPPTPSNQCLMRVRQRTSAGETGVLEILAADRLSAADFSADGRFVAIGEYGVSVHDAYTGRQLSSIGPWVRPTHSLQFSPDGSRLLVGAGDIATYLYDWQIPLLANSYGGVPILTASRFSPDGTRIACRSDDQDVVLYNTATAGEIRRLKGHALDGFAVAYSPDGTRIVTGGTDNLAIIWDAETGALLHKLPHNNWVNSTFFSPDGDRVVTACSDGGVRIWSASSGNLLLEIPHAVAASSAQFSPDGTLLCISRYGPVVEIRNAATGELVRNLIGHRRSVTFADWSSDGGRLLTVSWDSTARIWDLGRVPNQDDLSDRLWSIVEPNLSLRDVDMGRVAVGASRDSVLADWLCNNGTVPVRIDDISFSDNSYFSLVSGVPPFTLAPGECVQIEFRFSPGRVGLLGDSIFVHSGAFVRAAAIGGEGVLNPLRLAVGAVDFGRVVVGGTKDTVVTAALRNSGSVPLEIVRAVLVGPDAEQFLVLNGGGNVVLMPGESRTVELRFAPLHKGKTSGSILVEYATTTDFSLDLPPAIIPLYGQGLCPEDVPENFLSIPETLAASPGERVGIPVLVSAPRNSTPAPVGATHCCFASINPCLLRWTRQRWTF